MRTIGNLNKRDGYGNEASADYTGFGAPSRSLPA
jgi:hypothetical protein